MSRNITAKFVPALLIMAIGLILIARTIAAPPYGDSAHAATLAAPTAITDPAVPKALVVHTVLIPHPQAVKVPARAVVHKAVHKAVRKVAPRIVHQAVKALRAVHRTSFTGSASWSALWAAYPAWVGSLATCVAHHESWSAGLWRAHNPSSTASGFAQWLNGTWKVQSARAGVHDSSRALYASPGQQVRVFAYQVMNSGAYPWVGTHCGYGT